MSQYDYWENLEYDFGFSGKEMQGIKRAVEHLLASAKLEERPIKEYDPERDITENLVDNDNRRSVGYNQGAAAQYAAIWAALTGREKQ